MPKATVTRLFIGSVIAVTAGAILAIAAVWLAVANDVVLMSGADVVGVQGSPVAWSLLGLGIVGGVAVAGGLLGGLMSWIGALLNTWQLESKTWFAVLLLTGVFNFGFIALLAYLIAGPDGTKAAVRYQSPAPSAA